VEGRQKPITKVQCQAEKLAIVNETARPNNALLPLLPTALRTVTSDGQIPYREEMGTQQAPDAPYDRLKDLNLAVHIEASTTQAFSVRTLGPVAIIPD